MMSIVLLCYRLRLLATMLRGRGRWYRGRFSQHGAAAPRSPPAAGAATWLGPSANGQDRTASRATSLHPHDPHHSTSQLLDCNVRHVQRPLTIIPDRFASSSHAYMRPLAPLNGEAAGSQCRTAILIVDVCLTPFSPDGRPSTREKHAEAFKRC